MKLLKPTALLTAAAAALACGPLLLAAPAQADPGGYSASDQTYYSMLTGGSHPIVVTNFPILVAQATQACHLMATGSSSLDVIDYIAAAGPYSNDVAITIVSAAGTAYCHLDHMRAINVQNRRLGVPEIPLYP